MKKNNRNSEFRASYSFPCRIKLAASTSYYSLSGVFIFLFSVLIKGERKGKESMNEVRSRWQWHQNWSFVFTSLAWLRNKTSKPFVVVKQSKTLKNGQGFSRKVAPKSERLIQCRQWHGMWGKSPIKWAAHMEGFGLKHMEGSKRANRMWKLKTDVFLLSTRGRQALGAKVCDGSDHTRGHSLWWADWLIGFIYYIWKLKGD